MAKAVRSTYQVAARTGLIRIKNELAVMHIAMMSVVYYLYINRPNLLKFRNIFEMVMGD
jgi:hypothetical protein